MKLLTATKLAITAATIALTTAGALAITDPARQAELPIPDPTVQLAYEHEVADFLQSNPEPKSGDFGPTIDGQNAYWRAQAAWWEAAPWDAVAGQWGCTISATGVSFNPPDRGGLITAGRGGTGDCGGQKIGGNQAIFSVLDTRSNIVRADPERFTDPVS